MRNGFLAYIRIANQPLRRSDPGTHLSAYVIIRVARIGSVPTMYQSISYSHVHSTMTLLTDKPYNTTYISH